MTAPYTKHNSKSPEFQWDTGPCIHAIFQVKNALINRITLNPAHVFSCSIQGAELQEDILAWMEAYLHGKKGKLPSLDFSQFTTPFTRAGIKAICSIPFGKVATYAEVAKIAGNPHAPRAIGNVCSRNPYPLVIPCHRVVASNGSLGGFAYSLEIKQSLLEHETT